jgi:hypothetical protein
MEVILKLASVCSAGMFTGAAFYLTIVEHPARMSVGVAFALQEFRPSYKRAAPLQGALAIVCFLSSAAVAAPAHDWIWLIGGCLVGAVVPFTLFFMMPTNRPLRNDVNFEAESAKSLLAKWARLHAVRTTLSLLGFLLLVWETVVPR